ncbi:OmpA family protein [Weeksellaceae bacterium TAE3-ERU29]|nr:OmpA family protein [Weeksellaceae bacterium TAE3-ERU29]
MNKYKVLGLTFLLAFGISTNAQQKKARVNSDKGQIVMTKDELKSFLKMVAEKRIEQIEKMGSNNSGEVFDYNNNYSNNYQQRGGYGNGDLARQVERVNDRLDNLMLALMGKGSSTVVAGQKPGNYLNSDSNTANQISALERKLDSLKNAQYLDSSATSVKGEASAKKSCCVAKAKKSELTPERRSALEELLAKFKNFKRQVFFANNSYNVSQEDMAYLGRVTKVLKDNPELSVVLVGYASPVGNPEYNKQLSMKRAEAIAQALVKEGISEDRIIPAFYGEDHTTTEAKARRVDMSVVIK